MITPARRRLLLAAALVTAVISAALAPSEEATPPQKRAAKPPPPSGAAPQQQRVTAREIEVPPVSNYQRSMGEGIIVVDIFEPRPPPGAAAAPAKPQPPKLPFAYLGLIEESGRLKGVLAQGEQLHVVAKGEQFGGSYRLEEVGLDELVVTYLPLEARQTLSIGGPK